MHKSNFNKNERLGASFLSQNNGIDGLVHFFTTIAYQLAMQINWYKRALGPRVKHNPALPSKVDVQFHEFIIAWRNRGGSTGEMAFDECRGLELIAHLIICIPDLLKDAIQDWLGIPSIASSVASFCFTSIPSQKFTISHQILFSHI